VGSGLLGVDRPEHESYDSPCTVGVRSAPLSSIESLPDERVRIRSQGG
jgi:hypothetical protein